MESLADVLFTRDGLPVYVVPQAVMNEIVGFNIHRGCLALAERPPRRSLVELTTNTRRLVAMSFDVVGIGENSCDVVLRIAGGVAPNTKIPVTGRRTLHGGQVATTLATCRRRRIAGTGQRPRRGPLAAPHRDLRPS